MSSDIEGLPELARKLNTLEPKLTGQISRPALRAGAKVLQAAEKSEAPRGESGALKKSPKVRAVKRRARRGEAKPVLVTTAAGTSKTFYAPMVEFGHKIGRRKAAKRRGRLGKLISAITDRRQKTRPDPFIARAFASKSQEAIRVIAQYLRYGIEVIAKK